MIENSKYVQICICYTEQLIDYENDVISSRVVIFLIYR